ncbi:hypothetical protein AgCh_007771 [Apium graveolens]
MSEDPILEEVVVPFDDIVGKRIVVFSELENDEQHMELRRKLLLQRYKEAKGGIDEFERPDRKFEWDVGDATFRSRVQPHSASVDGFTN